VWHRPQRGNNGSHDADGDAEVAVSDDAGKHQRDSEGD
jgi:hypothetical protein